MKKILILSIITLISLPISAFYNQDYYGKVIVKVDENSAGKGEVSVSITSEPAEFGSSMEVSNTTNVSSSSWLEWSAPESDNQIYYLFEKSNFGYEFDGWQITSGNGIFDGNKLIVPASKNSSSKNPTEVIVTAKFKQRTSPVIVKSNDELLGQVSLSGNNSYENGYVTLKAEKAWSTGLKALNGYRCAKAVKFIGWFNNQNGECLSTEPEYSFKITGMMDITGRFELDLPINKDNFNGGYFRARYYSCDNDYMTIIADYGPSLSTAQFKWVSLNDYISFSLSHSDPANILQFTGSMATNNAANNFDYEKEKTILTDVNMIGQGTSTYGVTNTYFKIYHTAQPGLYKFRYSSVVLKATEHSMQNSNNPLNGHGNGGVQLEFGIGLDHAGDDADYQSYFELEPIDEAHIDEFYFGAEPAEEMKFDGGYLTSMYTSFPYRCWEEDGVEAYYVKGIWDEGKDYGMEPTAVLQKIEDGIVPAMTPVILKCKTTEARHNRLLPLMTSQMEDPNLSYDKENLLKGSFQLNSKKVNKTTFSSSSMKVLSTIDGEIGFYNMNEGTELTANRIWLDISSLGTNPSKIRFKMSDTTFVEGVAVDPSNNPENAPIYNLQGIVVKNTVPGQIYIKNGKKFVAR